MAAQSTLALLGVRSATLGTASSLAHAYALSEGSQDPLCHTDAARIGTYCDRTTSAEKIGVVVMGTERLSIGVAGVTSTVKIVAPASTTGKASLNLPHGTAPTSPVNGDMWTTSAGGLYVQINGVTVGPLGTGGGGGGSISGTIASNQVAYGSGTNTITGSATFTFTDTAGLALAPTATTAAQTAFTLTGAANTALTASTECIDVNFNLARTVQFATGALTTQRAFVIQAPTYGFVASSTLTNAATLAITNAPQVGANAAITHAYALWVQAGVSRFDGGLTASSSTLLLGTSAEPLTTLTFGNGSTNGSPTTTVTLGTTASVGTNLTGTALIIAPGVGTGTGLGGYLSFQTASTFNSSGTTAGTLAERLRITSDGALRLPGIFNLGPTPAVSATHGAALYYNRSSEAFLLSTNGSGYQQVISGTAQITQGGTGTQAFAALSGLVYYNGVQLVNDGNYTYDPANGILQVQAAASSGTPTMAVLTGGAHTALTASTEATDVNFNLARTVQFSNGALTTQRAVRIQAPTYAFVSGSNTITNAATLSISNSPQVGSFATLTNRYALWVEAGTSRFDGAISAPGGFVGLLQTAASTTTTSGLNIPAGSAPTSPVDGDTWIDSAQNTLSTRILGLTQESVGVICTTTSTVSISSTTTATSCFGTLSGTKTLPANFLKAGKAVRVRVYGLLAVAASTTVTFALSLGGTQVVGTLGTITITSLANNSCTADIIFVCRTTGTSGTVQGAGTFQYGLGSGTTGVVAGMGNGSTTTINTTISQVIDVTFKFSVSNAGNTYAAQVCTVEILY